MKITLNIYIQQMSYQYYIVTGNDWLLFVVIGQLCVVLGMWVMYWMRKEYKISKLTANRNVTGFCKLQKIMLTYGDKDEASLIV